ncbi:protein BTG1 [Puma concolor]|uniref:Protein BTG1 n=1 Tax=Puma concolor TaxID=9696 RepID=A0A6P6I4Y6_PUMCO|nr:protein BTG1 [Puma concolor]
MVRSPDWLKSAVMLQELWRLRSWTRRRLGKSERCDQTAVARLFLSPAASCRENNFFTIKEKKKHYKHHWFPEKPCKGSGYRCIRINHKMDPLIGQAAQRIGLSSQELFRLLPSELTLWVDPYEVSYRIGEDGSICVLYEASPAGGSTQNSSSVQMVDSRISCKEELLLGRTSPSKNYNMMTVSG